MTWRSACRLPPTNCPTSCRPGRTASVAHDERERRRRRGGLGEKVRGSVRSRALRRPIVKSFRDEVVEKLARASGLAPEAVDRLLDVPDAERGDFAMPCFPLAKERKAPPGKIAAEIAAKVEVGGRVAKAVA